MPKVPLRDLYVYDTASVFEAMSLINKNTMGMVFVVDSSMRLLGMLSDGDVRRGLLNGVGLDENVCCIMQKEYRFMLRNEVLDFQALQHFRLIPVVDYNHTLIDYYSSKNQFFPIALPLLNGNELTYLLDAFLSSWISSSGAYILDFEEAFAAYCGTKFGVSVFNGSVALVLALSALGITKGDEVIVPDLTFGATINAVLLVGATPVIVDIEQDSWCIDPESIRAAITNKTKAIIPVHLYGQVCDMDNIMRIAKEYKLYVVEDCAEAHGASFNGQMVGSFGDIGCFSFFGNKVITTGEGGMCVCNNKQLNDTMRILRDHGMDKHKRYWHTHIGFNYRMTNLQAAIGLAQLERIDTILNNRKYYESSYINALVPHIQPQPSLPNREKIVWLASFLLDSTCCSRDELLHTLKSKGVDARAFFYPLSDMPIYAQYSRASTPVSHSISARGFSLPTYESLQNLQDIIKVLQSTLKEYE